MNRVKRELRKAGLKLECDYETLPHGGIETVQVDSEKAEFSIYCTHYGWYHGRLTYDGEIVIRR